MTTAVCHARWPLLDTNLNQMRKTDKGESLENSVLTDTKKRKTLIKQGRNAYTEGVVARSSLSCTSAVLMGRVRWKMYGAALLIDLTQSPH